MRPVRSDLNSDLTPWLVACQLEGVIVVAGALQQVDDSRSVAPVDSRPEGRIAAPWSPSSVAVQETLKATLLRVDQMSIT